MTSKWKEITRQTRLKAPWRTIRQKKPTGQIGRERKLAQAELLTKKPLHLAASNLLFRIARVLLTPNMLRLWRWTNLRSSIRQNPRLLNNLTLSTPPEDRTLNFPKLKYKFRSQKRRRAPSLVKLITQPQGQKRILSSRCRLKKTAFIKTSLKGLNDG
jgi:hypothetical protein